MQKIPLVPVVIALVTLAVMLSVYLVLKDFQKKALQSSTDPFLWIPADAGLVLHIKNPSLLRESLVLVGPLGEDLQILPGRENLAGFIEHLDSLVIARKNLYDHWSASQIVFSLLESQNDQPEDFVMQITFPQPLGIVSVNDFFQSVLFEGSTIVEGLHSGEDIFILNSTTSNAIYYTLRQNCLVLSSRLAFLGNADVELQMQNSLVSDGRFANIRNASGLFSDNFYIRTSVLCSMMAEWYNYPLNIDCVNIAGWQLWDVSYQSGGIFLMGYAQSDRYGERFIDNLAGQQKVENKMAELIPLNTSNIVYLGVSDQERFSQDYMQWLEINEPNAALKGHRSRFMDVTMLSPDSLADFWSGEIAWVNPGFGMDTLFDDGVLILGSSNREMLLSQPSLEVFISEVGLDYEDEVVFEPQIFQLNVPGILQVITHGLVKEDFSFVSFSGDYLIASRSVESMVSYLTSVRFGYNFTHSEEWKQMQEFMQPGQSMFIYTSGQKPEQTTEETINGDDTPDGRQAKNERKEYRSFSMQLLPSAGNLIFSNAMLLHRSEYGISNPVEWELALSAPIHKGPYRVFNHNDGFTEIILQDRGNQLYLIDADGNILWQVEVSGPIMSDIYQVDIYKNDRYQYLFNTRNYLHLIDRNGDYVRGYPMRFPAPASAGIAVFDYDNNKNYRVLFPGENRRVYNYSLRRQPISGWQYKQSEHLIQQPLQCIRLENKDYLLTTDTTGKIELLDRRGISRLRAKQTVSAAPGNQIYGHKPLASQGHFIVGGPFGTVNQIFTDGTVFAFTPDSLAGDYQLVYESFTGENEKDLIFLHDGTIMVYNIASRLIFSLTLGRNIDADATVIELGNKERFIAVTDKTDNRLFLINSEGQIPMPFPLEGDTRFFIDEGNDNRYVVTGFGNMLRKYNLQQMN